MTGPRILDRQVKKFREAIALWKPEDTEEAMACRDLEDLLRVGIYTYEQFDAEDRRYRLEVARGEAKYSREKDDQIEANFAWWLAPCESVEKIIKRIERRGFKVENADKFRRYHRLARTATEERRHQHA